MNLKNTNNNDVFYFQTGNLTIKEARTGEQDKGLYIEGYASTKDLDSYNDIVNPEAFVNGLKRFKKNPVMLLQHYQEKLIGTFDKVEYDKKGLLVGGYVKYDIDNCVEKIRDGALRGFSIGIKPIRYSYKEDTNGLIIRRIEELELHEISVVTIPANPFTLFNALKKHFNNLKPQNMKTKLMKSITGENVEVIIEEENQVENLEVEVKTETPEVIATDIKEEVIAEIVKAEVKTEVKAEVKAEVKEIKVETPQEGEKTAEIAVQAEVKVENTENKSIAKSEDDINGMLEKLISIAELQAEKIEKLEKTNSDLELKMSNISIKKGVLFEYNTKNKETGISKDLKEAALKKMFPSIK